MNDLSGSIEDSNSSGERASVASRCSMILVLGREGAVEHLDRMADSLYLSLWFPSFRAEEMLPRVQMVMRQFPFSATEQGITYVSVNPISWSEASVFEQRMRPPAKPEEATDAVAEFAQTDFALTFEAYWDLWVAESEGNWVSQPMKVQFRVHGTEFEEGTYEERGHIEVDFGLDYPFLQEEVELSRGDADKVRANVAKLVEFTRKVEETTSLTGRVLWSESESNLAQKLISRLQKVH